MISIFNDIKRKIHFVLPFIITAIFIFAVPFANATDNAALTKEFENTFQTMMEDPSNIDVTLHYAHLAVKLKDYEAAIPALERILLFNPSLAKVKQELGVLYYRLKSYEVAQSYLEDAINTKGAPQEVIKTSEQWIKKIEARGE